ncbi:MAG: type 1 glutamine amidotransferase [Firmicutes bacterium]|nr:type 1 glutamine amidotransferase [Bacillota bacterium]
MAGLQPSALIVQNWPSEGPGLLGELLGERGWRIDLRRMDLAHPLPGDPGDFGALIVLGGPMSVHDEASYPYLRSLRELIASSLADGIPTLGICLGAQLMARSLGAQVRRNPQPEVGWFKLDLTREGMNDPILAGLGASFEVFQWHGETFDLPDGAVHLASSELCRNQAFRFGKQGYALQFHLEVTPEMIEEWCRNPAAEDQDRVARILARTPGIIPDYLRRARRFIASWIALAGAGPDR